MSRLILSIFFIFVALVCNSCSPNEKTAIVIDEMKITSKEFDSTFAKSQFAESPTRENRSNFLNYFINRKLILKEAVKTGFDKNAQFLENIQLFWEQALLKLMLTEKMKELSSTIQVAQDEVRNYYESNQTEFGGKTFSEAYDEIRLKIFSERQREALDKWINSLRSKAKIEINHGLLGLE